MKLVKNISIRVKLLTSFLTIVTFLGVIGAIGTINVGSINKNADAMYRINLQNIDELHQMKENLLEVTVAAKSITDDTSSEDINRSVEK